MDRFRGRTPHLPLSTTDPSEIRIVKVMIAPYNEPLQCSLHHISLDQFKEDKANYVALSYVWGDATQTIDIALDDTPFPITTNLFDALRNVRKSYEILLLRGITAGKDSTYGYSLVVHL